jgi:hypothetical protein
MFKVEMASNDEANIPMYFAGINRLEDESFD